MSEQQVHPAPTLDEACRAEFEFCRDQLRQLASAAGSSEAGAPVRDTVVAAVGHLDELEATLRPWWGGATVRASAQVPATSRAAGHRKPVPPRTSFREWLRTVWE